MSRESASSHVRFDFSTATKLLDVCRALREDYGNVSALLGRATSRTDLGRRLQAFKGIGPTTARILLREVTRLAPRPPGPARGRHNGRPLGTVTHKSR